jgi:hypothetical protein
MYDRRLVQFKSNLGGPPSCRSGPSGPVDVSSWMSNKLCWATRWATREPTRKRRCRVAGLVAANREAETAPRSFPIRAVWVAAMCPGGSPDRPRPISSQGRDDVRHRRREARRVAVSHVGCLTGADTWSRDGRRCLPAGRGRCLGWVSPVPPAVVCLDTHVVLSRPPLPPGAEAFGRQCNQPRRANVGFLLDLQQQRRSNLR